MNYTVVGLFEDKKHLDNVVSKLTSSGVNKPNIDVSPYRTEGNYGGSDYDYERREENESFWDKLFGSDSEDKEVYSRAGSRCHVVTVHAEDKSEAKRASEILDEAGAKDVNAYNQRTNAQSGNMNRNTASRSTGKDSVDVVQEELNVGKREVQDKEVKLKSRIIEKPVEENVRLKNERVYVKREPANREAKKGDFKDRKVEMNESHEEAVVEKNSRVVETVSLEKDVDATNKKVKDTLKETKVEVDENRKDRK
jgi:stress response protein YsnF